MITKEKIIKKIEILETGHLQIQYANRIMEDGVMIAETYERTVKHVEDDLSKEDDKIKECAKLKALYPRKASLGITAL